MYTGRRIETIIKANDGKQIFQIIINSDDINIFHYFDELEEKHKVDRDYLFQEKYKKNNTIIYKSDYVAQICKEKQITKDVILNFFLTKGIKEDEILISDISTYLIPLIYPYWKTSIRSGTLDTILPIFSNKYFTRLINDLIVETGFNIFKSFSRSSFCNGFFSLGKKYNTICRENKFNPLEIDSKKNLLLIQSLLMEDYGCLITNIQKVQIDGYNLLKVDVKDNFFLYHPANDIRIDVHTFLLSDIANIFFRNCPIMRDILTGFFEAIFYPDEYSEDKSPNLESVHYRAFEFDYEKDEHCFFDFTKDNWKKANTNTPINLGQLKDEWKKNKIKRYELCKSVNNLKNYSIKIDSKTLEPIKQDSTYNPENLVQFNYIEWTVKNNDCIEKLNIKTDLNNRELLTQFQVKVNKLFINYFKRERSNKLFNDDYIIKEGDKIQDTCTFFFYDRIFTTV